MEDNRKYLYGFIGVLILFFVYRYVSNPLVVNVTGTGKVSLPASSASVVATVIESGSSADLVESAIKAKVAAVRLAMVTNGVKETSLTQTEMQITPLSAVVSGAEGFSAQVSVAGELSDVTNLSGVIVKLYSAGASIVSQPVIEVGDQKDLEGQALKVALQDADKNLKLVSKMRWKMFKKMVNIQQASSGNAATNTKVETVDGNTTTSIELVKAVSVTYHLW